MGGILTEEQAVYQSLLHLSWVENLLTAVRALFMKQYATELKKPHLTQLNCADFDETFDALVWKLDTGSTRETERTGLRRWTCRAYTTVEYGIWWRRGSRWRRTSAACAWCASIQEAGDTTAAEARDCSCRRYNEHRRDTSAYARCFASKHASPSSFTSLDRKDRTRKSFEKGAKGECSSF